MRAHKGAKKGTKSGRHLFTALVRALTTLQQLLV